MSTKKDLSRLNTYLSAINRIESGGDDGGRLNVENPRLYNRLKEAIRSGLYVKIIYSKVNFLSGTLEHAMLETFVESVNILRQTGQGNCIRFKNENTIKAL